MPVAIDTVLVGPDGTDGQGRFVVQRRTMWFVGAAVVALLVVVGVVVTRPGSGQQVGVGVAANGAAAQPGAVLWQLDAAQLGIDPGVDDGISDWVVAQAGSVIVTSVIVGEVLDGSASAVAVDGAGQVVWRRPLWCEAWSVDQLACQDPEQPGSLLRVEAATGTTSGEVELDFEASVVGGGSFDPLDDGLLLVISPVVDDRRRWAVVDPTGRVRHRDSDRPAGLSDFPHQAGAWGLLLQPVSFDGGAGALVDADLTVRATFDGSGYRTPSGELMVSQGTVVEPADPDLSVTEVACQGQALPARGPDGSTWSGGRVLGPDLEHTCVVDAAGAVLDRYETPRTELSWWDEDGSVLVAVRPEIDDPLEVIARGAAAEAVSRTFDVCLGCDAHTADGELVVVETSSGLEGWSMSTGRQLWSVRTGQKPKVVVVAPGLVVAARTVRQGAEDDDARTVDLILYGIRTG